ncbi:MAG: methyltransferase family protein [Gemmatimonadales bacterium]
MFTPIGWLWTAFFVGWIIAAQRVKVTRSTEHPLVRYAIVACMGLGYILLATPVFDMGRFYRRFIPASAGPFLIPLATIVVALGLGFAVWARIHIGRNWSARVAIKEDHELIRTGPYARVRHPIYSGMLLAALATAIAVGRWRALVGFGVIFACFWIRSLKEERWMRQEFGPAYDDYARTSGHFIPRITRKAAMIVWLAALMVGMAPVL